MIDFSAFPVRKTKRYLWVKIPSAIAVFSMLVSFVFMSRPNASEREIGIHIFMATVITAVVALFIASLILSVWFVKFIIYRFIGMVTGSYKSFSSVYDNVSYFEQFSLDNGYKFISYSFHTPAPPSYYEELLEKPERDDVYVLYEIQGDYKDSAFSLYCLARAEGTRPGWGQRQGMAYAHDTDGRRIEYVTVLSTSSHIPQKHIGKIQVLGNQTQSLIFCEGYLSNRGTLQEMFEMLDTDLSRVTKHAH